MKGTTILSDFLRALQVPFTGAYSDSRFNSMSFKTLFGFSRLLSEYNIDNHAYQLPDAEDMKQLSVPFIARRGSRFVVVTGIHSSSKGDDSASDTVDYISYHRKLTEPFNDFCKQSDGVVLVAYPDSKSREPDYARHKFYALASMGKKSVLVLALLFLLVCGVIYSGIYSDLSQMLLVGVDMAGIVITWMLLQKSLNIHSHTADKVCGILQEHGCDTVLEQKASTFFGLFSWSEVGITYFTVTLALMLLFPSHTPWLALFNGCCLPFTIWSISYQRFKIHTWCTLCVITQLLLWLQFFCYLFGGWWHRGVLPLNLTTFMMIAVYAAVLMAINGVVTFIKQRSAH